MWRPLSEPVEAWHFAMRCPPEESGHKTVDIHFTADGIFNAVLFWYMLELAPGITLSSAPVSGSTLGMMRCTFRRLWQSQQPLSWVLSDDRDDSAYTNSCSRIQCTLIACPVAVLKFNREIVRPGAGQTPSSMQPALQYMAGELRVDRGDVLPLLVTHNTVRMRFDLEEAEYLNLATPDATFPVQQFSMLADTARNEVCESFPYVVRPVKACAK